MVMKKLILLFLVCFLFQGCSLLKFPNLNAPKPPQTTYHYNETFSKNPIAVAIGDKIVVVEQQSRTVTAGYIHTAPKVSGWQRFCNWIGGWSIIIVIIVLGCLAFGITGPAMFVWNRYRTFKKTTTQLIRAIGESKAVDSNPELKGKLGSMLDNDSKKVIDNIKRG